jgi:hypothetical protein
MRDSHPIRSGKFVVQHGLEVLGDRLRVRREAALLNQGILDEGVDVVGGEVERGERVGQTD